MSKFNNLDIDTNNNTLENILNRLTEKETAIMAELMIIERNKIRNDELNNKLINLTSSLTKLSSRKLEINGAIKLLTNLKKSYQIKSADLISNYIRTSVSSVLGECDVYSLEHKNRGTHSYTQLKVSLDENDASNGGTVSLNNCIGDGQAEIVSFVCSNMVLALAGCSPFVFLDECFRSVAEDKCFELAQLIVSMSQMGFQFIIIQHWNELFESIMSILLSLNTMKDYKQYNLVKTDNTTYIKEVY